jgi:hypothetical protein
MRHTRRKIAFVALDDREVLIRAQIGIGNSEIGRLTGFTKGQIHYRLAIAKREFGMDKGFRVNWRNGNHPLVNRILRDYRAIMESEIDRKLVPKLIHPEPEVVP